MSKNLDKTKMKPAPHRLAFDTRPCLVQKNTGCTEKEVAGQFSQHGNTTSVCTTITRENKAIMHYLHVKYVCVSV